MGPEDPARHVASTRCSATTPATRRRSSARSAGRSSCTTPGRSTTSTRWLKAQGDWVPLGGADEQKPAPDGTVEAWGRSDSQPARRLVRAEEGPPRPVRRLHAAAARGARPGRGHPRREEQPDAGDLTDGGELRPRRPDAAAGDPFEALGDPNRRAIVELLGCRAAGRSRSSPTRCRSAGRPSRATCGC